MALAIACPCAGPGRSVRRISRSRVPCNNSIRSFCSLVDILGDIAEVHLECQGEWLLTQLAEWQCDVTATNYCSRFSSMSLPSTCKTRICAGPSPAGLKEHSSLDVVE